MALRLASTLPGRRPAAVAAGLCLRALLMLVLLMSTPVLQAEASLEYRVKAAYLYNFTKFVNWPPETYLPESSSQAALDICVFGSDPFGASLDETMRGKTIKDHGLRVRRINQVSEAKACLLVYFGASEHNRLPSHLRALQGDPVLTVSDAPQFLDSNGMIRFVIVDGKVRFDINRQATQQAQLQVSSKLFSVAHKIVDGSGG